MYRCVIALFFFLSVIAAPFAWGHEEPHPSDAHRMFDELVAHLYSSADMLAGIAERMDARATVLAQNGKDSSAARPYITEAKYAIARAHTLLEEQIDSERFDRNPKGTFPEMKAPLLAVATELMRAKESLIEALAILKSADAGEGTSEAPSVAPPEVQ